MKQKRISPVLLIAGASGLAAGYLTLGALRQRPEPAPASAAPTVEVVVAARDLALGSIVGPGDVRVVSWPGASLPAGYTGDPAAVVGRGVILPVSASEPLLAAKLAGHEAGGGLPITIPPGMRAVSVRVDEVIGVAGFVLPGTRVDVLVTLDAEDGTGSAVTRVILQNVQAIAAGQKVEPDRTGKPETVPVITLLVSPGQAEQLALAASEGRIQLALRNTLDLDSVATPGARTSSLSLGSRPASVARAAPAAPPAARAPAPARTEVSVETYLGAARAVSTFSPAPR